MPRSTAYDSDVPASPRDLALDVDLPGRLGELFARHLTEWYAFAFYGFGLLVVGYLLVPSLLSNEAQKPAVACQSVTRRVVDAAVAVRRQDPMASLSLESGGPVAARLGGTIPTCPDGGKVELLTNGTTVETEGGVRTILSSEYVAGICRKPDGTDCHPYPVLERVHSLDAQLDRMIRPDSPASSWSAPPPVPTAPVLPEANSPTKKKPARRKPPLKKKPKPTILGSKALGSQIASPPSSVNSIR